ncbi:hypothetical protein AMTRI_Chr11g94710 [Amborella trichopoda]
MCCSRCGAIGFSVTDDSLYFCLSCGGQSQDIFEHGIDGASLVVDNLKIHGIDGDMFDESEEVEEGCPAEFGSQNKNPSNDEEIAEALRMKYVEGIQIMIQLQCEVEKFGVSPLVCGLVGPIWMRYLASTKVLDEEWANQEIIASEFCSRKKEERDIRPHGDYIPLPPIVYTDYARLELTPNSWEKSLMMMMGNVEVYKVISRALHFSYFFSGVSLSREAILPTDIAKWASEGTIPYLAAFIGIDKCLSKSSKACPLSSRLLFCPMQAVAAQCIEKAASSVAQDIGLHLPPVNFYLISCRILPYACRIYEWLFPPDLQLSSNDCRLPTRVYVFAILVIAIRLLYNINGLRHWEKSLLGFCGNYSLDEQDNKHEMKNEFLHAENGQLDSFLTGKVANSISTPLYQSSEREASKLLQHLESTYDKIILKHDYSKDMTTYPKYCKDVVFAGLTKHDCETEAIEAIGKIILDMEANGFWYLRPRKVVDRRYTYLVHADCYILIWPLPSSVRLIPRPYIWPY